MTLTVLAVLGGMAIANPGPTGEHGVYAWHLPGASNVGKTCAELDDDFAHDGTTWIEFKLEDDDVIEGVHSDGVLEVTISNLTSTSFDWSSNIGVDSIVVKDGVDGAFFYVYDGWSANANTGDYTDGFFRFSEETSDTGLTTPTPPFGTPKAISHISFCYDIEVQVEKTAETTFTRTFEWDIEKTVTPEHWDLFTGDSGTSEYTVTVTKTGFVDSDWAVNGTITIFNPHPTDAAMIESVSDSVNGIVADVDCGVTFPHSLAAGATLVCTYETDLPDGVDRLNTATVETSGAIGGGTATADVIFGDPTTLVDDEINVDDTFAGDLGTFSDTDSVSYTRTFACDDDEGQHDNTATIVETGQSDDASVTVDCYALTVSKNANTSFTRTWDWTIVKEADETDLLLAEGQLFLVTYTVTVSAISTDSDHAVSGTITISNPAPMDADLTAVIDSVNGIAANVNCPSLTVPAGGALVCTYSADLPDDEERLNTATATLQNYDFDKDEVATPSGTTDFSGSAVVDFADAVMTEIDECVDVSDTNVGFLGTVCAEDAPGVFNYSLWFGAHPDADVVLECGENTHVNVASFITNDTGTTGEDDETVNAFVACEVGCTLTPGYWKTHSENGPAPFDDTWDLLVGGSGKIFFKSGQSYYEVLWTPPDGGNAYYILAHAYIAAELNMLNGASVPEAVQDAFDEATALFEDWTPEDVGSLRGNREPRPTFIALAKILDDYNNGITGPGKCSE